MEAMQSLVDELYRFRDHYFETHDLSDAAKKPSELQEKLQECLKKLDQTVDSMSPDDGGGGGGGGGGPSSPQDKARVLYLRGRALNIRSEADPEAERLLSRAVKLEPTLVEAWNELGECYWKRGDVATARTCFEGALRHHQDKVSLRNLSILLRETKTSSSEERLRNIEKGLSKAREAVQLDTTDGVSWSILGNAYFAHFFSVSQNPRTLKQAMSAYKQAEKDIVARSTPELYYNKGVALKYEEDYSGALKCFERATALDPTWSEPKEQEKSLMHTLNGIRNLLELKGKLKMKRFNNLVESIHPKSLGPYAGGRYVSPNGAGSGSGGSVKLTEVDFKDLTEGVNSEKVVLGKVICSVHSDQTVPFTFCLTDRTGRCLAVNLYNLSPGKGVIIGDSVAIAEPYFTHIHIEKDGKVLEFDLIRVDSPLVLVINGKKAPQELQAGIELSTFTISN